MLRVQLSHLKLESLFFLLSDLFLPKFNDSEAIMANVHRYNPHGLKNIKTQNKPQESNRSFTFNTKTNI